MKSLLPHEMNKPRSRRLRKKLRIGEFQEFGIDITIPFNKEIITFDSALDLWIEFIESKGWAFGGGGSENSELFSGFICQVNRGSLGEHDLAEIQKWSKNQNWIKGAITQQLQDAWHGHD
ncbi:DUF469 family protein [Azotobacter chroococcum]|uniref:DUF469 family protein n=1 Tax=Azotobacter chroococcum TaxID=353 RepID=A0AA44C7V4_9GAMM|nr:50S ribosome-binding protein YggL [Azotobacter chroococcum]NHN77182.1 DUF469 family protein [Azotobacter chroococcum]